MKKYPHFLPASFILSAQLSFAVPPETHETVIHQLPDRRVVIERAPGIILPDPPEQVTRLAPEPHAAERLAEMAAQWRAHRIQRPTIHAGATVYRLPGGNTVTHVTNWRVNNGPPVSFWSSADFSLLAHPGEFSPPSMEGNVKYSILLFCSLHNIAARRVFMESRGREYHAPTLPELADGAATWMLDESRKPQTPDAATESAIIHLHEHYNSHLAQLKSAHAALETVRAAQRAELQANPPQPRDIHLRVSLLSPEQAAAWHQHALAESATHREATQEQGGAE